MAHYQTQRHFIFTVRLLYKYKSFRYFSLQEIVNDHVKVFTLRKFCIFACESLNCICIFTLSVLAQMEASLLLPKVIVNCLQSPVSCITQILYKLSLCLS
jgi:hypothetical protein